MNLKNAHPFTESAEGNLVHSHHGVLQVLALHHPAHLGQAASQGPRDLRSATHFCCKVHLRLKNQAREVYLESRCHLPAPLNVGPI